MQAKSFVILLGCALLSACGIKGPLYLPAPDAQKKAGPPQAQTGADHNKPFTTPDEGLPPALKPR
mgnify:CR=1 FL=1